MLIQDIFVLSIRQVSWCLKFYFLVIFYSLNQTALFEKSNTIA